MSNYISMTEFIRVCQNPGNQESADALLWNKGQICITVALSHFFGSSDIPKIEVTVWRMKYTGGGGGGANPLNIEEIRTAERAAQLGMIQKDKIPEPKYFLPKIGVTRKIFEAYWPIFLEGSQWLLSNNGLYCLFPKPDLPYVFIDNRELKGFSADGKEEYSARFYCDPINPSPPNLVYQWCTKAEWEGIDTCAKEFLESLVKINNGFWDRYRAREEQKKVAALEKEKEELRKKLGL